MASTEPSSWAAPGGPASEGGDPYVPLSARDVYLAHTGGVVPRPALPQPPRPTEPAAVVALVLGIVAVVPAAVVLAVIALRRIARRATGGRGMAWGAIIASGAWVLIAAVSVAGVLLARSIPGDTFAGSGLFDPPTPGPDGQQIVRASDLVVGDCVLDFHYDEHGDYVAPVTDVTKVPCTSEHKYEVSAVLQLTDGDVAGGEFPGDLDMGDIAAGKCYPATEARFTETGGNYDNYDVDFLHPTRDSWEQFGDREITCFAYRLDGEPNDSAIGGPPSSPDTGHEVTSADLFYGDCTLGFDQGATTFRVVPCTAVHAYEVVGFTYLDATLWPPQAYPDPASLQDVADARCRTYLEDYMYGAGENVTAYDVTAKLPPAADWESGDRSVICFGYPIGSGANDKPLAGDPSSSLGGADA